MLTICRFYNKDDTRASEEVSTWSTAEKMREQYKYVKYDGKYYEMILYSPGYGVYDQECTFAEVDGLPYGVVPAVIQKSTIYTYKYNKCECGANRVNSDRHSYYCPLFKQ
jgi:hypothetical protein